MSESEVKVYREKRVEFFQDFSHFEFSIGYRYTEQENWKHLVWINFMFWQIDLAF